MRTRVIEKKMLNSRPGQGLGLVVGAQGRKRADLDRLGIVRHVSTFAIDRR